ncbi:MAG: hypothetical protein BWK79_20045 [Beggiatoa sp. IS2]|nr:MAG: hypothetical protein BWK79_20045 [Beggiatoa sp. IS2]
MNTKKINRNLRSKSFVVTQQRTWLCPLAVTSTAIVTIIVGMSIVYYKQQDTQSKLADGEQKLVTLLTQNSQLIGENNKLKKDLTAVLQQTTLAEEALSAKDELHQALQKLQDENLDLKKQLAFYGNLLASSDAPELQVVVKSLTLKQAGKEREYTYYLTLTQFAREAKMRSGQVDISIIGMQDGHEKTLTMSEITEESTHFLKYSFRYFQNLEGRLLLPEQFIPKQAIVNLSPKGQKQSKPVSFAWQDLQ